MGSPNPLFVPLSGFGRGGSRLWGGDGPLKELPQVATGRAGWPLVAPALLSSFGHQSGAKPSSKPFFPGGKANLVRNACVEMAPNHAVPVPPRPRAADGEDTSPGAAFGSCRLCPLPSPRAPFSLLLLLLPSHLPLPFTAQRGSGQRGRWPRGDSGSVHPRRRTQPPRPPGSCKYLSLFPLQS